jgi:hypothetical protein
MGTPSGMAYCIYGLLIIYKLQTPSLEDIPENLRKPLTA